MEEHGIHPGSPLLFVEGAADTDRTIQDRTILERALPALPVRVGVFFVAFLAMTQAGYLFAYAPYTGISVFWPAAGLALAVLLLEHVRHWPAFVAAIFLAELLGAVGRGLPLPLCLAWSVSASGEPLLAAWLLRRKGRTGFVPTGLREILSIVLVGALFSPALAAAWGASAAVTWLDTPSWSTSWLMWWLGDALGVLVVAPFLVVWLGCTHARATARELVQGVVLVAAMVLATEALFGGTPGLHILRLAPGFLTFPIMLWAAVRFELRGVTIVAAILNVLAAYHTVNGKGMFADLGGSPVERLLTLQAYLSFVTLSSLALAATFAERRRRERELQDLIDNSTAVIFAKRPDGRYFLANREFVRIARRPRARIVGHTAHELWPLSNAEAGAMLDREVLRSGQPSTREEEVPVHGELRTYVTVRFPLRDEAGAPYAVCGVSTDITPRKRAEEALRQSEERLGLVVTSTHDAIFDWDLRTDEVWCNDRYRELFGAGATGRYWQARIHEEDRAEVMASLQAAWDARAGDWTKEFRFRRGDGTLAHILDNACLLYDADGKPVRVVGAAGDITERRQAQEQLRKLNAELEQRVERRTAELAAAYREMESFSYSISHDLRGPLRAINGFGKVLLEDHAQALPPVALESVNRIRAASQRMGHLIDDLLTLARASRGEVCRVDVNLGELADNILRELRNAEPGRSVTTVVAPGLSARGDPGLLRIVLENLLSNAWKFTNRVPVARIEVGAVEVDGETAFYVRDNGAGFDERYAAKLFQPFERLHRTNEFPGSGIGLATIQRIIGRHGGRVWAAGRVDEGATFYFALPPKGRPAPR